MKPPKVSKNKVEQTIDLEEVFGVSFKGSRELREYIGQIILDKIRERTLAGKGIKFEGDVEGSKVKLKSPYSKAYQDSIEFKAFGKSKSEVNMTLTGDMLGLMDITKQEGNKITIGWNDEDQIPKAYNHIVGDTVPSRPFFGISISEMKGIVRETKGEIKEALQIKKEDGKSAFTEYALGLLDELNDGSDS
jgi:hypothetical protein